MNRKLFVLLVFVMSLSSVFAQQTSTLYFMKHNPVRHSLNPAFGPEGYSVYVGTPAVSVIDVGVYNNSLIFKDIAKIENGDLVSVFKSDSEDDISKFLDNLHRNLKFDFNMQISLLNFGFRGVRHSRNFYNFGLNTKIDVHTTIPSGLFKDLLTKKTTSLSEGVESLARTEVQAIGYTEVSFGFGREITENLTVGGKLKYLYGHFGAKVKLNQIELDMESDKWTLKGNADGYIACPGFFIYNNSNDPVNQQKLDDMRTYSEDYDYTREDFLLYGDRDASVQPTFDYNMKAVEFIKPSGHGGAIDLGATYKMLDGRLLLTASAIDLGFIRWGKNLTHLVADANYEFNPVQIEDEETPSDVLNRFKNEFLSDEGNKMYYVNDMSQKFITPLTTKIIVGAEYSIWDDRFGAGLMSKTSINAGGVYEELVASANFRPHRFVDITLSYDLVNGRAHNLGAGFNFNLGPINLFAVVDNIPLSWKRADNIPIPAHTPATHVSVGLNFLGGWLDSKDDDGDGVGNRKDKCPDTPFDGRAYVDRNGCLPDEDADGVYDYKDKCPNTALAVVGSVDTFGCPIDSDNDGVADYLDKCPNTPLDIVMSVDATGCPIDTDADGVADYLDRCPNTVLSIVGSVDSVGCPTDNDKDGVADYMDKCPDTPKEAFGMVDSVGCPLDTDGDGIVDYLDKCPTVSGVASAQGCPEIKAAVKQLFKKALNGIQFESGKSVIKKASYPILDQIVKVMKDNPTYNLRINGHTDSSGDYNKNKILSTDRANAVKSYIVKKGISEIRMIASGFGSDVPVADNATSAGRSKNRRVEFIVEFESLVEE